MEPLKFNKSQLEHTININPEEHFLRVIKAEVKDFQLGKSYNFPISLKLYEFFSDSAKLENVSVESSLNQSDGIFDLRNRVLVSISPETWPKVQKAVFSIDEDKIGDEELTLFYETRNLDISIDDPWVTFKKHFEEDNNTKILFSAPFGQGKTTFLKEFFRLENESKGNYEVFHLFPVNYAVKSNEDIFRLIKTQILVKLLENPTIEFKKESFSYLQTLPHFALKNAHKILSPFLKALPDVGESAFDVYEKLEDLTQKYFVEHDQLQIEDRKTAEKFIQQAYEDEGSIFEDNFYSQLIRQLIQQLKDQGKQTVLIIDDTDRMDPEHIFRILNVFAAHFDAPEYRYRDSNKFGFDKIIIVCDYDNLHKIFSHKYGPTTDFAGYIDKFFSKEIFKYDNSVAIKNSISSIIPTGNKLCIPNFDFILSDLVRLNAISLREILKIKKNNPVENAESFYRSLRDYNFYSILSTIHLFAKLFSTKIFSEKVTVCRNKITAFDSFRDYHYLSSDLIKDIVLIENNYRNSEKMEYNFEFKKQRFGITINRGISKYQIGSIKLNGDNFEGSFSASDFYELVLIAIEKYEKVITEK